MIAMATKTRILIADDHAEVRAAVRDVILEFADVEVVALTADVAEAAEAARAHQPDIAFVDAWLEGGGAEKAAALIKAVSPRTLIIALASARDVETVLRLRAAGAAGCYEKEDLTDVLPEILAGARR